MEWKEMIIELKGPITYTLYFGSFIVFFLLIICSIILFQIFELDTNFIITFILAIFSISISIYFFSESGKISQKTIILLNRMGSKLDNIEESMKFNERVGLSNIANSALDEDEILNNYTTQVEGK